MAANVKNLPLSVIFAAKSGDGQALGAVLNHYQRYIRSLATRTLTDECGPSILEAICSNKINCSCVLPIEFVNYIHGIYTFYYRFSSTIRIVPDLKNGVCVVSLMLRTISHTM